ncbi:uncharacterized protein VNE69_07142 [Vairimorpha necatrix]|uniref:Uncharacterized protein n=1 Tax=Vairimorpha necatrix TaxID=6039 RepID=A0AAX4JDM4_9MICR
MIFLMFLKVFLCILCFKKSILEEISVLRNRSCEFRSAIILLKTQIEQSKDEIKKYVLESKNQKILTAFNTYHTSLCQYDNRTFPHKEIDHFEKGKINKHSISRLLVSIVAFEGKVFVIKASQDQFVDVIKRSYTENGSLDLNDCLRFMNELNKTCKEKITEIMILTGKIIYRLREKKMQSKYFTLF